MAGLLLSRRVAEAYGGRIAEIAKRAGAAVDIVVCPPDAPPAGAHKTIEIAFYSRDVWEGCDKTFVNVPTRTFFEVVDRADRLRWLHVTSAGADLPMYQPSLARRVRVTTSSGSNAEPIAQTVLACVLSLARKLPHWLEAQRKREWSPLRGAQQPHDLRGQTAVIVGTGPIGREIARLLHAVGLRTVGIRRSAHHTAPFDEVTGYDRIDHALPRADWLVIACPLTEVTAKLIDARRLALLPRGSRIVNIARGEIVEEPALIAALQGGRLAGAYLDVFAVEPLPPDSPLWTLPDVILTPHNSSASDGNHPRGVEIFLRNLDAYLGARPMENEVALR